jgi:ATP synthase protein I
MITGHDRHDKSPPSGPVSGDDEALAQRLRSLDARLDAVIEKKETAKEAENASADRSGIGQALRLSSEFGAGIIAGAGLGWGIDRVFGTSPWGMIILFMLGFCAGLMNVVRASGMMSKKHGS